MVDEVGNDTQSHQPVRASVYVAVFITAQRRFGNVDVIDQSADIGQSKGTIRRTISIPREAAGILSAAVLTGVTNTVAIAVFLQRIIMVRAVVGGVEMTIVIRVGWLSTAGIDLGHHPPPCSSLEVAVEAMGVLAFTTGRTFMGGAPDVAPVALGTIVRIVVAIGIPAFDVSEVIKDLVVCQAVLPDLGVIGQSRYRSPLIQVSRHVNKDNSRVVSFQVFHQEGVALR